MTTEPNRKPREDCDIYQPPEYPEYAALGVLVILGALEEQSTTSIGNSALKPESPGIPDTCEPHPLTRELPSNWKPT